ncbi:hypothetical protein Tco_0313818 [Tanacetum coccineum]
MHGPCKRCRLRKEGGLRKGVEVLLIVLYGQKILKSEAWNDNVLGTLKFVPKGEDNQVYGKTIPRAAKPKKSRKWKQPTSALKKESSLTADDNIISDDPDAALELANSINRTKAEEQETSRLVHETHKRLVTKESTGKRRQTGVTIRDTHIVLKKKTPVQTQKLKVIEMLSEAAVLEEAQMKKAIKLSKRDTSFHHQTGGSNEGAGSKP